MCVALPPRTDMTMTPTRQRELRVALLLNWRGKGYSRPHYGLVDDEELLRTGKSIFLSTDGRQLPAIRADLLLLQHVASEIVEADLTVMGAG